VQFGKYLSRKIKNVEEKKMIVEVDPKKSSIKRIKGLSKNVNVELRKSCVLVLSFTFNNLVMNKYVIYFYDDNSFPVEIPRYVLKVNLKYLF
jgi:hypothetical protein